MTVPQKSATKKSETPGTLDPTDPTKLRFAKGAIEEITSKKKRILTASGRYFTIKASGLAIDRAGGRWKNIEDF